MPLPTGFKFQARKYRVFCTRCQTRWLANSPNQLHDHKSFKHNLSYTVGLSAAPAIDPRLSQDVNVMCPPLPPDNGQVPHVFQERIDKLQSEREQLQAEVDFLRSVIKRFV